MIKKGINMEFKVEKNVPMPKAQTSKSKYDFVAEMEIGDSFEVNRKSLANSIQGYCARVYKVKLAQRSMGDSKWRLWRVE
jgi:hypothetical protein